ncbi:hypothetical protein TNCV_1950761 [Trichonephila clavipes]|nr:hypothetical protein TNCV_1950761 [Trichonephila clavipes]
MTCDYAKETEIEQFELKHRLKRSDVSQTYRISTQSITFLDSNYLLINSLSNLARLRVHEVGGSSDHSSENHLHRRLTQELQLLERATTSDEARTATKKRLAYALEYISQTYHYLSQQQQLKLLQTGLQLRDKPDTPDTQKSRHGRSGGITG